MSIHQQGWLIVFGEIEGLRWVIRSKRMAWSAATCPRASRLRPGDQLILYVGRGAFNNPSRDRSQLVGLAEVLSPVRPLRKPVVIAGREFVCACDLRLQSILPERGGVPMEPYVERLGFIRRKDVWGAYLRSGLVELPTDDLALLRRAIAESGQGPLQ